MDDLAYNKAIRDLLGELSALSPRLWPDELCCNRFDDLYFPRQSLPKGYPRDTWERGQVEWKSCFDAAQLDVLAKFHKVFASQLDTLPTAGQWRQDPGWRSVSKAARAALDELEDLPA